MAWSAHRAGVIAAATSWMLACGLGSAGTGPALDNETSGEAGADSSDAAAMTIDSSVADNVVSDAEAGPGDAVQDLGDGQPPQEGGVTDTGADSREAGPIDATPETAPPDGAILTAFGYAPSNFTPASYANDVPVAGTTVNCTMTYMSPGTAGASTWCSGTGPFVIPAVSQPSGGTVDILVFRSLALTAGNTLSLRGTNPVILAVYGDVTVDGTIDATGGAGSQGPTGSSGTPGPLGTPGAGGNSSCAMSAGGSPPNAGARPGGGGAGSAESGGAGGSTGDMGGAAGVARGSASGVPLLGGCPGGNGGVECEASGGAGGGAVQISAAGTLVLTGIVNTSGGPGGGGRREGNGTNQCTVGMGSYTGGGGGGSAGDIVLEGSGVSGGTLTATGGAGGANGSGTAGGAGGLATVGATQGAAAAPGSNGGATNNGGSGGGGSGGYVVINSH